MNERSLPFEKSQGIFGRTTGLWTVNSTYASNKPRDS